MGWIDWSVLGLSIVAVLYVGFRARSKTHSVESFLLGDRNLPWWAILGSIVATETSTATVLSVPAQGFKPGGLAFLQLAVGFLAGRFIVAAVLLPLFFQGKLFSAYEVLQTRFGAGAKRAASLLFLVCRNLGDGLRLYLAALVLEKLMHWDFVTCAVLMGAITITYTLFGGMRSIVWNDCIQLVIYMMGGVATVFLVVSVLPAGWQDVSVFLRDAERDAVFVFGPEESVGALGFARWLVTEPLTFWAGLLGGCFLTLGTHGTDQLMVQRYLSARSQREAGWAVILSGFVVLLQFALFLFIGVLLACLHERLQWGQFEVADDVYIQFMLDWFPENKGLLGLMLAAVFAAAMSTLSSSLNASASAFVNDFYMPIQKSQAIDKKKLFRVTRWAALGFGALQIAIGIWATRLSGTVVANALTIAGYSAGVLLGWFGLAIFASRLKTACVVSCGVLGLSVLAFCQFLLPVMVASDFSVAWPWFAAIGANTTFWSGMLLFHGFPRFARQKQHESE